MDLIRNNRMAQSQPDFWTQVLIWVKDNTLLFGIFALTWKGIDKVFRYFSDSRDAELRKIVHEEMNAPIANLTQKIEDLSNAIWNIKQQK